jgi:Ase1/PRC1/MAP65 family protein
LKGKRDRLVEEKKSREKRLRDLRTQIEQLYQRLGVSEAEQKQFFSANRGCGMRTINEFEDELARLNELKRQNLGLFVEESRIRLQELWDSLYFSEEEMLDFTPAFSDVYSDALLSAHEAEIERLTALKDQRAPVLAMIDEHRSLIKEREDLAASSQDASRLIAKKGERRDPTRLLREEKMRKRIQRELPKVEAKLKKCLQSWENEYGRSFLVHGDRYLDEIERCELEKKPSVTRSKTPLPGASSTIKVPTKGPAPATASKSGGTIKKAPPPRSKTPTAMLSSVARNPPSSIPSTANKSPSRIPARVPLSGRTDGGNSPDRKFHQGAQTIRNMGPPRLPPPKMQDLFSKSTATISTPHNTARYGGIDENLRSGSIVRQVAPEDPYDDRSQQPSQSRSQFTQSVYHHHQQSQSVDFSASARPANPNPYTMAPPYSRPGSRQISNTSNTSSNMTGPSQPASTVSGSENWETYDDASEAEPEVDATDAYYAKLRAQQAAFASSQSQHGHHQYAYEGHADGAYGLKRATPEGGYNSPRGAASKKARGLMPPPASKGRIVAPDGVGPERIISGSEAGWTDEDGF